MDVSSKYFSLLKRPSLHWPKYVWYFLIDIYRVGKLRELCSFALWEINHKLRVYQFAKQYISFTDNNYLSLTSEDGMGSWHRNEADTPSFLCDQGFHFQPVVVDWKYCVQTRDSLLWGCRFSSLTVLCCSHDQSQSAIRVYTFDHPITSLFLSSQDTLFVCANGVIYKSEDRGASFRLVLQLSTRISYFLFNNGMTELPDQRLMIGEYGSIWHGQTWENLAFLYYSSDGGNTWTTADFLKQQGVNKHIHLVKYCARLNAVLLTDGDNKKQVWINSALTHFDKQAGRRKDGWQLITKHHHQTGGYTSMAETAENTLLGSDYLGGTNFIVSTADGKQFRKLVLPDPYRRSPVMNMVIRQSSSGEEVWASSYSCLSNKAKSLLMCTTDSGNSWARIIEFDGTKHEVRIASSSPVSSNVLYISITEFGEHPDQHRHKVYKLERHSVS
ncbi:WD40/YVTN/BNR-like repeat-containing protein [Spirosoma utsteinense]|uniref:Exo-alpha-sialidase n=1 Tax=Spirosoma utsteinense TaxID=2585773 RepID=A0ABR6W898_9BACT|nr:sialidase family protein [Spirosoma utsteinense]MBC3784116.1 hypothetical protein [Spirosoma utsteinense]MBC3792795.1 hypothetical protein [Spirosoma utsteinense]